MVEFVSHGCREQQLEDCDSKGSNFVSSTEQSPLNNSAAAVSLDDWQHHAPPYHPSSPLWVSNDCFIFPWILSCWLIINFVLHFVMMLQHVLIPSPRLFSKNMMSLRSHMLIFWHAVGHRGHAANNCACCRTNQKFILSLQNYCLLDSMPPHATHASHTDEENEINTALVAMGLRNLCRRTLPIWLLSANPTLLTTNIKLEKEWD